MLIQSADTADDERDILIGAPKSALDDTAKSQRRRYRLASALGHERTLKRLHPMSALLPKADIAAGQFSAWMYR